MSGAKWDDDDDWVGEPPEGRHTREQSDPSFWNKQPLVVAVFWLVLLVLAVVVIILAT